MKVMNNQKFYPVGTIVNYRDTKLQIVEQEGNKPSCAGCYFIDSEQDKRGESISCYLHGIACTSHQRKDSKHIILKEVVVKIKNE